jgi:catalase (peroxidase I)
MATAFPHNVGAGIHFMAAKIVKGCLNRGRIFETRLKGKTGLYRLYEIHSLKTEHRLLADILTEYLTKMMSVEEAPKYLRLAFHDAGNYDAETNLGGANGSLRFELDREENISLKPYFEKLEIVKKEIESLGIKVSYADLIAFGGAVAVYKTGGPKIYLKTGRTDSDSAGARIHFLSSGINIKELLEKFSAMGLGAKDLVALSGAHTIGRANGLPMTEDLFRFSNSYYKNLLAFCNGMRMENLGVLNSDIALLDLKETRNLIELFAGNEFTFFNEFAESYQKLSYLGQTIV